MKLLLGTNNKGKAIEIREALGSLPVTLLTPEELNILEVPEETGSTFMDNAELKARFFHTRSKIATLADDSGIIVDALKDELGVQTRRWGAGPEASDEEWIAHFLKRMEHEVNRKARFICTLAYIDHEGRLHTFEGETQGMITKTLEADYLPGLPISAVFKPEGVDQVYSALTLADKNRLSHRGKALQKLAKHLERLG